MNDTVVAWVDFHMQLMVSVFNPQVGFNPNFVPDGDSLKRSITARTMDMEVGLSGWIS